MPEKIAFYENLHDLYKALGLPVEAVAPNSDFNINSLRELHVQLPYRSEGFRPNYFSFVFVKDGRGRYTTDDQTFDTQPGTIYFTNPGHFKSFELFEIGESIIITFTEAFLKENVHREVFREFPFLLAETVPPKVLSPEAFGEFEKIYRQIWDAFYGQSPFRKKIIGSFFMVLLLRIKEYFWLDYNPIQEGSRSSQIVKTFKRNLESHFRKAAAGKAEKALRVQDLAEMQHLHANYLNQVIRSKTGKTINTWIAERTVAEARALLQHTAQPVKEIAYLLGFSEVPHFSNYFKKQTGQSPASFRKSLPANHS
ncbi:AraC family transcriptional regulator [Chitinophaga lutea]